MEELTGEMRRRERDTKALVTDKRRSEERAAQAEAAHRAEIARHHAVAAQLEGTAAEAGRLTARISQLEQELASERERYVELFEARKRESDARHIRLLALETFNKSDHLDRVSPSAAAWATRSCTSGWAASTCRGRS